MSAASHVDADLTFSVTMDGEDMCGSLRGQDNHLELTVSDPALMGGSGTGPARELADRLAAQGIQLTVNAGGPLVTLGVPKTSMLQRRVTGSRHIRVESLRAAWRLLRLRRATPQHTRLVPSATPLPLAPTFLRRRRQPTTTHDPDRGGYPRLVTPPDPHFPDAPRTIVPLGRRTVLGSAGDATVPLAGLLAHHAEVIWRDDDEFVIVPVEGADVRVHGAPVVGAAVLRTGTRVELGGWTLVYSREEYADHGRPFGGRIGGELGHQRPQPPRERIAGAREAGSA